MFRISLLFVLLMHVFCVCAQEKPGKMKGLLWEISGNGIGRPGYLYGTMHVSEKMVFNLSDSFFIALCGVDMVALETNHDEWQQFMDNIVSNGEENPFGGNGGNYRDYSKNLYNESFRFKAPSRELLGAMLSVKPVMTNEFLYRSNEYLQDYEEDTYLDLFIFQAGKKLGKKVIGLESLEGSYEAVTRSRIPDDDEKESRPDYYPNSGGLSIEEAYRRQDIQLIDSINKLSSPGKNFQRWMLDERNTIMANGIDSILRSGTSLFSAVGAAHLPGETGVIQQLRKKGFTVRAVQFTNTSGLAEKEKIDKIRYPVQIGRYWLSDSSWSAEAPGRFYPTFNAQGFEQHLSADMSNGVFYAVYRLKTFGWWTGQRADYIAKRLDSLIYERIPGKIFERNRLSEPFPGHEISTRTRRGDVQRFKIFITPTEVVMFTIGGNGDYALGDEAKRFLNGIQYCGKPVAQTGPNPFEPQYGGFRINFPAPLIANTTDDPKAQQYIAVAINPTDNAAYFLYRTDYNDLNYIEEDTFELNIIGEKIAEQFTKSAPLMQLVAESPYPTQDITFRADQDSAWHFLRLVIDGPHYYLLGCRKNSPGPPTPFFNSFTPQLFRYPQGLSTITDTSFKYTVTALPEPEKSGKAFIERIRKIYEEGARKMNRQMGYEEVDYDLPGEEKFTELISPLTGELVSVRRYTSKSGGALPSIDSFKTNVKLLLAKKHQLTIRESWWEEKDGLLTGNFLLGDTNSTRGIRAKVFVINRSTYRLAATVNLKAPESEFLRSVFSTFTPTDTIDGTSLFGKRSLGFLQNIYARDSVLRASALSELKNIWRLSFEPQDFQRIKAVIEQPDFSKLKFRERKDLIHTLRYFPTEETAVYLRNFYRAHSDSVRYQLQVLETLAAMKTQTSFKTLLDLWVKQPLYSGEGGAGIFSVFMDTLELTATVLPKIQGLADLEETREETLSLLQSLLEQDLIKPKNYVRLKPMLLREASWMLSKHRFRGETSSEKRDNNYYSDYEISAGEQDLKRNLNLLAPFLPKDKAVKDLCEQTLRFGDDALKIFVYGLYLRQDIPVDSQQLKPFIGQDKTRFPLFQQLAKAGKTRDYAGWFSDTSALIQSYLIASKARDYGLRSIDSIRFLSRHKYSLYKKPAFIYFFEVKQKDDKEWGLAQVVVLQSLQFFKDSKSDTHKKRVKTLVEGQDEDFWNRPQVKVMARMTEKEKETYIKKKIAEIRFTNRERYNNRADDGGNYYQAFER